jgi:hypothetical protein
VSALRVRKDGSAALDGIAARTLPYSPYGSLTLAAARRTIFQRLEFAMTARVNWWFVASFAVVSAFWAATAWAVVT